MWYSIFKEIIQISRGDMRKAVNFLQDLIMLMVKYEC